MMAIDNQMAETAEYLRARTPHVAKWPEGRLEDWLEFWRRRGCAVTFQNEHGQIIAAAVARPVKTFKPTEYEYADDGEIVFVEVAAADNPKLLRLLWLCLLQRFGRRFAIAFHRAGRGTDVRTYEFARFQRKILART